MPGELLGQVNPLTFREFREGHEINMFGGHGLRNWIGFTYYQVREHSPPWLQDCFRGILFEASSYLEDAVNWFRVMTPHLDRSLQLVNFSNVFATAIKFLWLEPIPLLN